MKLRPTVAKTRDPLKLEALPPTDGLELDYRTGYQPYFIRRSDVIAEFSLASGESKKQGGLREATYTIEEHPPDGWVLSEVTCEGDFDAINGGVEIDLGEDDHVTCTFSNTKLPDVPVLPVWGFIGLAALLLGSIIWLIQKRLVLWTG